MCPVARRGHIWPWAAARNRSSRRTEVPVTKLPVTAEPETVAGPEHADQPFALAGEVASPP